MAPVALGLINGGGGRAPPCGTDRLSGAPGCPPPISGAGGGGSVAVVLVPSACGTPGAFGSSAGLNASWPDDGAPATTGTGGGAYCGGAPYCGGCPYWAGGGPCEYCGGVE